MKRFFIIATLICVAIGSASAQKKQVKALTEKIDTLMTQNRELQDRVNELTAIAESNKVLAEQLKTMVSAYQNLENAYKSNSEQIAMLTAKIDELISAPTKEEEKPDADTKPKYKIIGNINNGLALVKEGDLYGYVNARGEYVITPQFVDAEDFYDGRALVKKGLLYGFINTKGEYIASPQFEVAGNFSEGLAAVKINDKWGYINTAGKLVIAAKYQDASTFDGGEAHVKFNNKKYLINTAGKITYEF